MVGENHPPQFNIARYKMRTVDFGKCLRAAQSSKGVSSSNLAKILGVHRQQINIWRNKENCRLDTLLRVCDALKYGVEDFLQG